TELWTHSLFWVTTETNISEMICFWQEEKHKFVFNCSYLKLFVDICVIPLPKNNALMEVLTLRA
ncbi:hypothetical protein, partial [Proteus mirabilis]